VGVTPQLERAAEMEHRHVTFSFRNCAISSPTFLKKHQKTKQKTKETPKKYTIKKKKDTRRGQRLIKNTKTKKNLHKKSRGKKGSFFLSQPEKQIEMKDHHKYNGWVRKTPQKNPYDPI